MSIRVHIGGRVCLPEEAKISIFDRGFLYGDSVYETIGTFDGRLFATAEHLARLERSAKRIGLRTPPRAEIERAIAETVAAAGNEESRVRVMVTRGAGGKIDLDPASVGDTQLVVIVFPLGAPTRRDVRAGRVGGDRLGHAQQPAGHRPGGEVGQLPQQRARARRGAAAVGRLRGDPVRRRRHDRRGGEQQHLRGRAAGEVRTPPLEVGILDGITRAKVLELARENGIPLDEARISPDELRAADEVFITSATRARAAGDPPRRARRSATGVPGPVTRRLMELLAGARAEEPLMSPAAAFMPKFFAICSVILIADRRRSSLRAPAQGARDAGRAPGEPLDDHGAGFGGGRVLGCCSASA